MRLSFSGYSPFYKNTTKKDEQVGVELTSNPIFKELGESVDQIFINGVSVSPIDLTGPADNDGERSPIQTHDDNVGANSNRLDSLDDSTPEPIHTQVDSIDEPKARTICQQLVSFFSKCKRQESEDDEFKQSEKPLTDKHLYQRFEKLVDKTDDEDLYQRFLEHLDENRNPIYSKVIETTEANLNEIERLKHKLDASKRNQLPLQTNRLSLKKSAPSFDPNGLLIDTNLSEDKWEDEAFIRKMLGENKDNYWKIPIQNRLRERYLPLAINEFGLHSK